MKNSDFQFEAPVGTRILSRKGVYIAALPRDGSFIWWLHTSKVWVKDYKSDERCKYEMRSNCAPCRSFKAFKRHIKKHKEMLKGCTVTLQHRFEGHNITIEL